MMPRNRLLLALVAGVFVQSLICGCAGFHFDVAADMRSCTPPKHAGPQYFEGVCEAIRDLGPGAFMVVPGDLDPPDRVRAVLDAHFGKDYVMYPVAGNHELDKPEYMSYLNAYNGGVANLPGIVRLGPAGAEQTCYSFDHRNAHFVVLNEYYDGAADTGTDGDVVPALLEWLAQDLADNEKSFVFVCGHEPFVSIPDMDNGRVRHRGSSLDKYAENSHRFWSLLREHNVVAYFCGHTHNVSIAKINGVYQIDAGHARGQGDPGAPSSFLKVYVGLGSVRCEVYRYDGESYKLAYEERLR